VLCLRILQTALVYVNTLMLQDVLAEPAWADILTPADRRGLTPLFWMHVLPYGEVKLDMNARLSLALALRCDSHRFVAWNQKVIWRCRFAIPLRWLQVQQDSGDPGPRRRQQ